MKEIQKRFKSSVLKITEEGRKEEVFLMREKDRELARRRRRRKKAKKLRAKEPHEQIEEIPVSKKKTTKRRKPAESKGTESKEESD